MQQHSRFLVGLFLLSLNGCAAGPVALTLFGVGAGVTTGTAVSYTMDGIAVAKQGIFFKDRATATEIILQTERILGKA